MSLLKITLLLISIYLTICDGALKRKSDGALHKGLVMSSQLPNTNVNNTVIESVAVTDFSLSRVERQCFCSPFKDNSPYQDFMRGYNIKLDYWGDEFQGSAYAFSFVDEEASHKQVHLCCAAVPMSSILSRIAGRRKSRCCLAFYPVVLREYGDDYDTETPQASSSQSPMLNGLIDIGDLIAGASGSKYPLLQDADIIVSQEHGNNHEECTEDLYPSRFYIKNKQGDCFVEIDSPYHDALLPSSSSMNTPLIPCLMDPQYNLRHHMQQAIVLRDSNEGVLHIYSSRYLVDQLRHINIAPRYFLINSCNGGTSPMLIKKGPSIASVGDRLITKGLHTGFIMAAKGASTSSTTTTKILESHCMKGIYDWFNGPFGNRPRIVVEDVSPSALSSALREDGINRE